MFLIEIAENDKNSCPSQGLRARARPNLGATLLAFVSYSAERVTSDLGLHSRWHSIATFPLSENRVFTTVSGSSA